MSRIVAVIKMGAQVIRYPRAAIRNSSISPPGHPLINNETTWVRSGDDIRLRHAHLRNMPLVCHMLIDMSRKYIIGYMRRCKSKMVSATLTNEMIPDQTWTLAGITSIRGSS
jgi:GH35 family endo-1,4-beta-xylanase